MKPQILTYGENVIRLDDDSNTFIVNSSQLKWENVPTVFVTGISDNREKFDFYKAYKNKDDVIMHCEYRSTNTNNVLIVILK